jgi:hypothetical protein
MVPEWQQSMKTISEEPLLKTRTSLSSSSVRRPTDW